MAHGQGGAEIGFDRGPTLTCNHEAPIAAYAIQAGALRTNPASGPDGVGVQEGHAYTLEARAEVQAVCVTGQVTHTLKAEGFDASDDRTGRGTPLVPVGVTIHGTDPTVQKVASYDDIAQCLRARTPGNIDNSSTTVVQQPIVVHGTKDPCHDEHIAFALAAEPGMKQTCYVAEPAVAFAATGQAGAGWAPPSFPVQEECSQTLDTRRAQSVMTAMQVRRLTPRECERLQGFQWQCGQDYPGAWQDEAGRWWSPDYTLIPWRKKPAEECPDGPRYKALGNSWAVPNVRWIGKRIDMFIKLSNWIS